MAAVYEEQMLGFAELRSEALTPASLTKSARDYITTDATKISWSRGLINDLIRGNHRPYQDDAIRVTMYRPFTKHWGYTDRHYNDLASIVPRMFPTLLTTNCAIGVKHRWSGQGQICLITDCIGDLQTDGGWQYFPLYLYERVEEAGELGFAEGGEIIDGYRRHDAITGAIHEVFRDACGTDVTKEDIFYYVYGILHSSEYRTRFAADLKKMLPRIPLTGEAEDFWAFSKAGRELAEWHLNYETIEPWPVHEHSDALNLDPEEHYKVQKMTFARPTAEQKAAGEKWDKTRIKYNSHITLSEIPLEAYDYVVNGKPAIEWIMERYQVTRDKASGIVNDPNDWCTEHNNPRYIVDLVKRIVRVSIETMKIVESLPALNERVADVAGKA